MGGDAGFRILASVDGSAPSRLPLQWAVTEALLRNGQIRAVTAREFPPVTVGMESLILDRDRDVFPQTSSPLQNEALKRVNSEGVTVTGDAIQGKAAAVLLRAAGNEASVDSQGPTLRRKQRP